MGWSNEFKVGALMLVMLPAGVWAFKWSVDGLTAADETYTLHLSIPSADGIAPSSSIKLAGVQIGEVSNVELKGGHAQLDLAILVGTNLPVDTMAEIRSESMLTGERYIVIDLGDGEKLLKNDDWIFLKTTPADFEKITKQVEGITEDVKVITAALRKVSENDANREALEATLQNIAALSAELRNLAERNSRDIDAIVDSVGRLSVSLEGFAEETSGDVDEEMEKLKEATDSLKATIDDVRSVTKKIDDGEGTIGALVNDATTVELLNDTIGNANEVIEGFSGMHAEVYYNGRMYFGAPNPQLRHPEFFYGNPLAGGGANIIGIRLMPQEDFWYNFEIVDYPQGTVTYKETLVEGQTPSDPDVIRKEWVREPDYRMTFMMNKRFRHWGFRLGVKEDGGGVGASYWTGRKDQWEFQADIFDFDLNRYPAVDGIALPNARVLARYRPMPHMYVEAGTEQPFQGAAYGYFTGFAGAGFNFNDDDIKLLFATLPLNF